MCIHTVGKLKQSRQGKNVIITIVFMKSIKSTHFPSHLISPSHYPLISIPKCPSDICCTAFLSSINYFRLAIFKFPPKCVCLVVESGLMMTHAPAQILMLRGNQTMCSSASARSNSLFASKRENCVSEG